MKPLGGANPIDVEGYLLAWDIERARLAFIEIEGQRFLPIFSTEENLHTCMREIAAPAYTVKVIREPDLFLEDVEKANAQVCIDARRVEGKVRFSLLVVIPQLQGNV